MKTLLKCLLLVTLTLSSTFAQEKPAQQPDSAPTEENTIVPGPQAVFQQALQHLKKGEFRQYVQALTFEEQCYQAGVVLFVIGRTPQPSLAGEEQTEISAYLLSQDLQRLSKHYANSSYQYRMESLAAIEQTIRQMVNSSSAPPNFSRSLDRHFQELGRRMKSPGLFLMEALSAMSEPTIGPDGKPLAPIPTTIIQKMTDTYQEAQWDFYIRGDNAIAILKAETSPQQEQKEQKQAVKTIVEFQRVEGEWKISQCLPEAMLTTALQPLLKFPALKPQHDPFSEFSQGQ